jgi:hypothetical protein
MKKESGLKSILRAASPTPGTRCPLGKTLNDNPAKEQEKNHHPCHCRPLFPCRHTRICPFKGYRPAVRGSPSAFQVIPADPKEEYATPAEQQPAGDACKPQGIHPKEEEEETKYPHEDDVAVLIAECAEVVKIGSGSHEDRLSISSIRKYLDGIEDPGASNEGTMGPYR